MAQNHAATAARPADRGFHKATAAEPAQISDQRALDLVRWLLEAAEDALAERAGMSIDDDEEGLAYCFKDGELHFTKDGLRHFTKEERTQIKGLYIRLGKKFDEICEFLAKQARNDCAKLSDAEKSQIADEAQELIENWESDVEMSNDPKQWSKAASPEPGIQTLLAAHHELSERIQDIQDEALAREMGESDDLGDD